MSRRSQEGNAEPFPFLELFGVILPAYSYLLYLAVPKEEDALCVLLFSFLCFGLFAGLWSLSEGKRRGKALSVAALAVFGIIALLELFGALLRAVPK